MIILGIETSCDETAAAVLSGERTVLSNVVLSQTIHYQYGGVVPELASRAHIKTLIPIVRESLSRASIEMSEVEAVAATFGPGLVGSLLVGLSAAKALAYALNRPFIGVNHIEGHLFANFLEHHDLQPPLIHLIVSGGHTRLIHQPEMGRYRLLGQTRDDAAGESFDKVAKMLGIGYPGGPEIDRLSERGDEDYVRFPRAYLGKDSLDFSFSGLKTAVLNYLRPLPEEQAREHVADIAASFQAAVVDVLVEKTFRAARRYRIETVAVAGGVACNRRLRRELLQRADREGMAVRFPSPILCTDNAAMIAAAGHFHLQRGDRSPLDLNALANLDMQPAPVA